jgi:hypothetical protein
MAAAAAAARASDDDDDDDNRRPLRLFNGVDQGSDEFGRGAAPETPMLCLEGTLMDNDTTDHTTHSPVTAIAEERRRQPQPGRGGAPCHGLACLLACCSWPCLPDLVLFGQVRRLNANANVRVSKEGSLQQAISEWMDHGIIGYTSTPPITRSIDRSERAAHSHPRHSHR